MQFVFFEDEPGIWRWQLLAASGWIIAVSAESYVSRSDCLYAIQVVRGAGMARIYDQDGTDMTKPDPRSHAANARRAA
jgi:uncharacterized protein YegP (UPF0339 family)